MRGNFACLVILFFGASVVKASTKNASVLCFKREASNILEMYFNLDLNTDPVGALWALNNTEFSKTVFAIDEVTCTSSYNSTQKIYTVKSVVDLDANSDAKDENVCGRVVKTDSGTYYEWLFLHLTNPPVNSSYPALIRGDDRAFRTVCKMDNLTSDVLTSNIRVETPNLQQTIVATPLNVVMMVQRKTGPNTYADVSAGTTLDAGTFIRLKATYTRPDNYADLSDILVHSVYFYNATLSANSDFSNGFLIIDDNGCANTTGTPPLVAPLRPSTGFKGSIVGNTNVHVTGEFILAKIGSSPSVYFSANFLTCNPQYTAVCVDPCFDKTSFNESASTRRRRQAEDEDDENVGYVTYYINVRDVNDDQTTAESATEKNTMVIIGAIVGASLFVILCLLILVLVLVRRRNGEKLPPKQSLTVVAPPPYGHKY